MRYLPALLAFAACGGVTAAAQQLPQQRDGVWLQNGIRQYERLLAHATVSEQETNNSLVVTSYVCAILDLEKYLVQRADLLAGALEGSKKKKHLDPHMLEGMTRALPLIVPLAQTRFFTDSPSCERAFVIVRDYLDLYPEMLPKDADEIVEKALLDAYTPKSPEP
jgi:hypothetical protein